MMEAADYGIIDLNIKMCCPIPQDQQLLATGTGINISKTWSFLKVKLFINCDMYDYPLIDHMPHLELKSFTKLLCEYMIKRPI
jgi:hypothetical protein